ncbi:MAG: dihydrofolate reductase [bacterium]|nr:dihydrofolate reductase [bacterium]
MTVAIIVAISSNGVIGRDGGLPWRLSTDLKRFKALTMGHHLIMGRRTWDEVGKPLPGRRTIVVTRNAELEVPSGVHLAESVEEALKLAKSDDEPFVAGGAEIYRLAMPMADRYYLTRIHAEIEGDTFFEPDFKGWKQAFTEDHPAGEKDEYPVTFEVWERVG